MVWAMYGVRISKKVIAYPPQAREMEKMVHWLSCRVSPLPVPYTCANMCIDATSLQSFLWAQHNATLTAINKMECMHLLRSLAHYVYIA